MSNFRTTIPEDISRRSKSRSAAFSQVLDVIQPDQFEIGQIWSTASHFQLPDGKQFNTDMPRLIVIVDALVPSLMHELAHLIAAPISIDVSMATEYDLCVKGSMSPFGFDFMVETWNQTQVLVGQFKKYM